MSLESIEQGFRLSREIIGFGVRIGCLAFVPLLIPAGVLAGICLVGFNKRNPDLYHDINPINKVRESRRESSSIAYSLEGMGMLSPTGALGRAYSLID